MVDRDTFHNTNNIKQYFEIKQHSGKKKSDHRVGFLIKVYFYYSVGVSPLVSFLFFLNENLSRVSLPIPIAVITNTASTKVSDGENPECDNEFTTMETQRKTAPINAITGFTDVDPLSSLNKSITHFLNVIIVLFLFVYFTHI